MDISEETIKALKLSEFVWGVRWTGETTVTLYSSEAAARGLFKHYGEPGEELIRYRRTPWEVIDSIPLNTKKEDDNAN